MRTYGVASDKGGVGKTTTALHLADELQRTNSGPVCLFDGDNTRISTNWYNRGRAKKHAPAFDVHPIEAAAMLAGNYENKVIDTGQQPGEKDLLALAQYCDVLIVPCAPAAFDVDGLGQTIRALRNISRRDGSPIDFRVLLTRVAHHNGKQVEEIRRMLTNGCVTTFDVEIPECKAFQHAAAEGLLVGGIKADGVKEAAAAYAAVCQELLHEPR